MTLFNNHTVFAPGGFVNHSIPIFCFVLCFSIGCQSSKDTTPQSSKATPAHVAKKNTPELLAKKQPGVKKQTESVKTTVKPVVKPDDTASESGMDTLVSGAKPLANPSAIVAKIQPLLVKLKLKKYNGDNFGWPDAKVLLDKSKYKLHVYPWTSTKALFYFQDVKNASGYAADHLVLVADYAKGNIIFQRSANDFRMYESFAFFDGGAKSKHLFRSDSFASGTCSGGNSYTCLLYTSPSPRD